MPKNVLVFDFGASSARAMLCTFDGSEITLKEVHRFTNIPIRRYGTLYWDFEDLWENVLTALGLGVFNGGFEAISIDTWGVDFALLDSKGRLIESPVHYRDKRTEGIPELIGEKIPDKELYMSTGIQSMRINTIYQLYSLLKKQPNMLFKAERFLMMPDLFAYMLTGVIKNEYTEATTTQLVDPQSRSWNLLLIEDLGLPARLFSPLINTGDTYGMLKLELCDQIRIEPVPVIACPSHDTASAVMAVPATDKDFIFISCGTWTLFGTELEQAIINEKTYAYGLSNEGGYGATTTLLKNIMGLWLIQETKRFYEEKQASTASFSDLERLAAKSKPFKCFINPNDNLFSTPDDMPLKIMRFCNRTNQYIPQTIGEIMRCIYDSLAAEFAVTYEQLCEVTGKKYNTIHMIGGGTRDKLLCQNTADAIGKSVVAGPVEATALGNGISSLIRLGEIESVEQARKILAESSATSIFEPQNHNAWTEALVRFKSIV